MNTDTYDEGLHLNVYGAEKVASWLGRILVDDFGLTDHRSDEELSAVYNERLKAYNEDKEAQRAEFEETGYISKYRNQ